MPAVDRKKGACYIWTVAIFLFLSVTIGGIFLGLYIIEPPPTPGADDDSSNNTGWYPYAGVALVALPWFFWILTLLYRVISRAFGFRMVCWDTTSSVSDSPSAAAVAPAPAFTATVGGESRDINGERDGGNETAAASMEEGTSAVSTPTGGGGDGVRRVQFGGVVVLGEENDRNKTETTSSPVSARSIDSQDSEAPFRYAMATS